MIDLLVVNYNTLDKLIRLLDTLESDYEPGVFKLYIRDNDSPSENIKRLFERLKQSGSWKSMPISGVYTGDNIGYSGAINEMASLSSSDILCAVNADTWFTTNHLKEVQASFDATPEMSICGVKQMDENCIIRHGGIFWDGQSNPVHRGWSVKDEYDIYYKDKLKCWTVSGSIYYVRRNVWNELLSCPIFRSLFPEAKGAFLPTPHFFEETYCSVHAQHHGHQVWYDGTIETAGHSWHASSGIGEASRNYFNVSKNIYVIACDEEGIKHECR